MILKKLARYQLWADDVVRGLVGGLTDEEFSREVLPPFGSVRSLCAHITIAIEFNLKKHVGKEEFDPEGLGEEVHAAPKESLLDMWREADLRLLEFAESRSDETYVFPNFLREGQITLD
jgi:uncharacterized damage-inducible protein DinB